MEQITRKKIDASNMCLIIDDQHVAFGLRPTACEWRQMSLLLRTWTTDKSGDSRTEAAIHTQSHVSLPGAKMAASLAVLALELLKAL